MTAHTTDESVLSPAVRAHISHAVIAAYVADAVEASDTSAALAGPPGKSVRVAAVEDETGIINLELKLILRDEDSVPVAARAIDAAVRRDLGQFVAVPVANVRLVFEDGS